MKRKNRPLALKLLIPMLVLIVVEITLLVGSVFGGNLIGYMENNEIEILHERVVNRKSYLQNEMLTRWSKLDSTARQINTLTKELLEEGKISLDTLDDGSQESYPLLNAVAGDLIEMLRANKVTGAFLVLNTDDLEEKAGQGIYQNKPGLYFRDYDPESNYSERNVDLLLEYAPSEVVKNLNISLDSNWKLQFEFASQKEYGAYLYEPFQAALHMEDRLELQVSDMGYWSEPYHLNEDDLMMISYSVPLILDDGTVYGVLGIDLSLNYLETLLPSEELKDKDSGSYLLGIKKNSDTEITNVLISGKDYTQINGDHGVTEVYSEKGREQIQSDNREKIYCDVENLKLYNTNTPFVKQQWVLIGIIRGKNLFVFSNNVIKALLRGTLLTLAAGVIGGILISLFISRPVTALTDSVRNIDPLSKISFSRTGIREIDLMAEELEHLNEETLYAAERFSYIMNTANLPLAVFEVNSEEDRVFITGRFFELLGIEETKSSSLTENMFWEMLKALQPYRQTDEEQKEGEIFYKFPASADDAEHFRYVKIALNKGTNRYIGLVEDVTSSMIEKESIEYERDHDLLSGLLNRRAFKRIVSGLFQEGRTVLKTAAFVMIDLDELKHVNDTYGHEYGDRYIRTAAQCFLNGTPKETIVSRQSGDEFNLFFYGYDSQEEIRRQIEHLREHIGKITLHLPDHTELPIRMSAGITWYPQDTVLYEEIRKYSDYAMYKIKHGTKNQFGEFNKGEYLRDSKGSE